MGNALMGLATEFTAGIVNLNRAEMPVMVCKCVKKNKVANKLVAKWFNRHEDRSFDMNLIAKRGFYKATEMEADIAEIFAR